jgi:hypothetical protein
MATVLKSIRVRNTTGTQTALTYLGTPYTTVSQNVGTVCFGLCVSNLSVSSSVGFSCWILNVPTSKITYIVNGAPLTVGANMHLADNSNRIILVPGDQIIVSATANGIAAIANLAEMN